MKIAREDTISEFKPVKLTLTLESQKELDAIRAMTHLNEALSIAIVDEYGDYDIEVEEFLEKLREVVDG